MKTHDSIGQQWHEHDQLVLRVVYRGANGFCQADDFMSCEAWQRHPCVELEISLALFPGATSKSPHRLSTERIVGAPFDGVDSNPACQGVLQLESGIVN